MKWQVLYSVVFSEFFFQTVHIEYSHCECNTVHMCQKFIFYQSVKKTSAMAKDQVTKTVISFLTMSLPRANKDEIELLGQRFITTGIYEIWATFLPLILHQFATIEICMITWRWINLLCWLISIIEKLNHLLLWHTDTQTQTNVHTHARFATNWLFWWHQESFCLWTELVVTLTLKLQTL